MRAVILTIILIVSLSCVDTQSNLQDEFVKLLNGNWELESRISNGKPADTEGAIYFNLTKKGNGFAGEQLATESGVLDAFVSGGGDNKPYEIASLFAVTISPGAGSLISFNADGEIMGNYGPFTKGVASMQIYNFIFSKGAFVMQNQKHSTESDKFPKELVKQETEVYDKIILTKDKLIMHSSLLKTTDTYIRVSKKGGKVGGVYTLKKFYQIFKEKIRLNRNDA